MKHVVLHICMLALIVSELFSQPAYQWMRRYNSPFNHHDYGEECVHDNAGNYYVSGTTRTDGVVSDITLLKYNSAGALLWSRQYNGPENSDDQPTGGVVLDTAGNVYVAGSSYGSSNYDYVLLKYNSSGTLLWERRYNGLGTMIDRLNDVVSDNSGNIYVTGASEGPGSNFSDYLTIKYNSNGDTLWVRRYETGPGGQDLAYALTLDNSGNVYVTGDARGACVTIKYNSSGGTQWANVYDGGGFTDAGIRVKTDDLGSAYVCGHYLSATTNYDMFILKLNSSGGTSWVRTYNGPTNEGDLASSLDIDGSGNVILAGSTNHTSIGQTDIATIKYNSSGVQQWARIYGAGNNAVDAPAQVTVDNQGSIYVCGQTWQASHNSYDPTVIKYSSDGTQLWLLGFDTLNSPGSASSMIISAGSIFIAGSHSGFFGNTGNDIIAVKYDGSLGVQQIGLEIPSQFSLLQNYPNPFNPTTSIQFSIANLPAEAHGAQAGSQLTILTVYDVLGRAVRTLVNENLQPGTYATSFDANGLASGIYVYRLQSGSFSSTKKMLLTK